MNKQLFVLDTKYQLSFDDMIDKVENIDNRIVYYYNKDYIIGKTVQYCKCQHQNGSFQSWLI